MNNDILKYDETFLEFPSRLLEISDDSNYFVISNLDKYIVVRENNYSVSNYKYNNKDCIKYIKDYYNVMDGEKVLRVEGVFDDKNNIINTNLDKNVKIINLNQIYKVKKDEKKYLDIDQVFSLNNYNNEDFKIKK